MVMPLGGELSSLGNVFSVFFNCTEVHFCKRVQKWVTGDVSTRFRSIQNPSFCVGISP